MRNSQGSSPAELRKKHSHARRGEVIVEDAGDAIVLRTVDQVVARAQALSRELVAAKTDASVEDFLADRAREAEAELRVWPWTPPRCWPCITTGSTGLGSARLAEGHCRVWGCT